MFGFIKKVFVVAMTFFNFNPLNVNSLECISMKNQECKVREEIANNKPMFYPFSFKVNRCNGNFNNISNSIANSCVPDAVKKINLKAFNLISWSDKNKQIKWYESRKCEWKLNSGVYNNKQKWNKDKCRCESKEIVDKKECHKGFIFNPSNCNCEYRKKVAHLLVEKCDEVEIIDNKTLSIKECKVMNEICKNNSCKPHIIFIVFLIVCIIIGIASAYYYIYLCSNKILHTDYC